MEEDAETPVQKTGYGVVEPPEESRKPSLLTESQRQYLLGEKEFGGDNPGKSENTLRKRIRDRVRRGLIDSSLLPRLSDLDRELIFSDVEATIDDHVYQGIVSLLRFLYLGISRDTEVKFEHLLEEAIRKGENVQQARQGRQVTDVTVKIDIETEEIVDSEQAREKLDRGDPIDERELYQLAVTGALDPEDLEVLREYPPAFGAYPTE